MIQDGITAQLYAERSLTVGYNKLAVRLVRENGRVITETPVLVRCDLEMGQYHHGAPAVQPAAEPGLTGVWDFGVVFTMPSLDKWSLVVSVHDQESDKELEIRIPVRVSPSNDVQIVESNTDGSLVFVLDHSAWQTGLNTFDLLLFSTADSVAYTPIKNAVITVNPTMPSMGHGSSGNRNPKDDGNGLYSTTVNLIMSGEWDIAFSMNGSDDKPLSVHFSILVP